MENLIQADIFFFITGIFVVFLIIGFIISLFYLVPILRDLRHLSETIRDGGDRLSGDLDDLRGAVREEGGKIKSVGDYFLGLFIRRQKINRKK